MILPRPFKDYHRERPEKGDDVMGYVRHDVSRLGILGARTTLMIYYRTIHSKPSVTLVLKEYATFFRDFPDPYRRICS